MKTGKVFEFRPKTKKLGKFLTIGRKRIFKKMGKFLPNWESFFEIGKVYARKVFEPHCITFSLTCNDESLFIDEISGQLP